MTKQQLENYYFLCGEIDELKAHRKKLERELQDGVADSVLSAATFPFSQHVVTIHGGDERSRARLDRLTAEIVSKEGRLAAERDEVSVWIDGISSSRMRRLMRLRYFNRLGWTGIAARLDYNGDDAARMAHDRFLKKYL